MKQTWSQETAEWPVMAYFSVIYIQTKKSALIHEKRKLIIIFRNSQMKITKYSDKGIRHCTVLDKTFDRWLSGCWSPSGLSWLILSVTYIQTKKADSIHEKRKFIIISRNFHMKITKYNDKGHCTLLDKTLARWLVECWSARIWIQNASRGL